LTGGLETMFATRGAAQRRKAMQLPDAAKRMLDGEQGAAKQLAMDSLVKFGEAYDAMEMVEIGYAHVAAAQPLYAGDMGSSKHSPI
jgi:predicted aconitase